MTRLTKGLLALALAGLLQLGLGPNRLRRGGGPDRGRS